MLFKNKVDINSVQVGQWTKIIGTITIDDETKNHRVIVEQLNILNKANIDETKPPSIDEEHEELWEQWMRDVKYTK